MNEIDSSSKVLLALSLVEELSLQKKTAISRAFDDAEVLRDDKALARRVLGEAKAADFYKKLDSVDEALDRLAKADISYFTINSKDYPKRLVNIDDRPIVLFVKGDLSILSDRAIGVVGARRPTRYGAKVSEEFAREFARAGFVVVSGFARGVDSIAHKSCLDAGGKTVAVFAGGLDICYPAENRGLQDKILETGSAIISEYPLGAKPLQYHFPERNRIISGLSEGVFLAEAAKKSGSLITMRLAIEQGKDIFAVPGNIYSPESEGSNALIMEMPHAMVTSPEDVLGALGAVKAESQDAYEPNFDEAAVLDALRDGEKHIEELLSATGLNLNSLNEVLLGLQLAGLVEDSGGNYYSLSGV